MVMRDPRPVQTGLYLRLKTAIVTPKGEEELGWDWKEAHDYDLHGMLNEETLCNFQDIYDQSERHPYGRPTSLCAMSWASFLASEEMLLKGNVKAIKALENQVNGIRGKVYANVETHGLAPPPPPPWIPKAETTPPDGGGEPLAKKPKPNDAEVLSESL